MRAKVCPVTRQEFREKAVAIPCKIGPSELLLEVKEFSTGSFGFWAGQKIVVEIGEKRVICQLGMNLTVVGSKDAPK